MRIRTATEADLDEILEHNNRAVPAVNELTRADLDRFLATAHSFLVLEASKVEANKVEANKVEANKVEANKVGPVGGSVGGFLIGLGPNAAYDSMNYRWFSARYESFIYVDRIVVAASGRGAGVGTLLYDSFAAAGRGEGAPVMLAEVNIRPRNDESLAFHERHGFVPVGEQDTESGAKRVVMLQKTLAP